ncbi:MAG: putative membrane protein YedE/YeeE [Limisphaerales bacterium]|jgi:uncharacterized membrane protein YedE/YeeE
MMLSLAGGVLIGLAAVWLFASLGRVAGISGIFGQAMKSLTPSNSFVAWPWLFLCGLAVGGWVAYAFIGPRAEVTLTIEHGIVLLVGGLLVGFGTRLGSGCTSGHGVCGMARFSKRSIIATVVYLCIGILTATAVGAL